MTREEYQDRFWDVSDEKWKELEEKGLVPDRNSEKCWAKFNKLMQTPVKEKGFTFDDDTIIFMCCMNFTKFGDKFDSDSWHFMLCLD